MSIESVSTQIAIISTFVGAIYWYLRNDFTNKKETIDKKNSRCLEENKFLKNQINEYEKFGTDIIFTKIKIDAELENITKKIGANSGTIYIPFPQTDNPTGLKIISITPVNIHTSKLYNQLIPLSSKAGSVFSDKKPQLTNNANDGYYYKAADTISGYTTVAMLTIPIIDNENVIAVLQLLNDKQNYFGDSSLMLAQNMTAKVEGLPEKINNLTKLSGWQNIFRSNSIYQSEVIMYCDLTSSAVLFNELNIESTFDHINSFFEEISNIALQHGALIDKYMGDGVLFRFATLDHSKPFEASLEIRRVFQKLRSKWKKESGSFSSIYIRIGIAHGPIVERIVGHPQYQSISIFGQAVNIAVNLCDIAPRDKNIIIISHEYKESLDKDVLETLLLKKITNIGKAGHYSMPNEMIAYLVE